MADLTVPPCDALIIVPPFARLDQAALGPHLLQACARQRGFDVRVLYANVLLADWIGVDEHETISRSAGRLLIGERFFAPLAFGRDARPDSRGGSDPMWRLLTRTRERAAEWLDALASRVVAARIPVVGCSTMFEQTSGSIAILQAIKSRAPETLTLMGGANCAGPMAGGIASLSRAIDYVFSGDSDEMFPRFLERVRAGRRPEQRVLAGDLFRDLESLPVPAFSEYYEQMGRIVGPGALDQLWLPYETSRGCWWGEKHHCTFCGLNGEEMVFREKSPDRVIDDLRVLRTRHPRARIFIVDDIMPYRYFDTVLPRLAREVPGLEMFSEQKSNLSLQKTAALRRAGMIAIQPGIESLSTPLLRHMEKGVTAAQNVALLRYARSVGLPLIWSMLHAFPSDAIEWYAESSRLVPMLTHLHPPNGLIDVNIERFSPYFEDALRFGVTNVRPAASYRDVLPVGADHQSVAYQFEADYATASRNGSPVMRELRHRVDEWRARWESGAPAPVLAVVPLDGDQFLFVDTRDGHRFELIDRERADAVLTARCESSAREWAVDRRAATTIDGRVVPLAFADPDVLAAFEAR